VKCSSHFNMKSQSIDSLTTVRFRLRMMMVTFLCPLARYALAHCNHLKRRGFADGGCDCSIEQVSLSFNTYTS
jgi:hypothetical protein